ncbi:MAG TPA: DNA mismatch repair protein MutS [Burkholderiaceae bacterium]|nr:DNA mismatch repair protein MutS [Burkholderiaceae bacterium]
MKALLMHPGRDFDTKQPLPWNAPALVQDLELDTLLGAMHGGDNFVLEVSRAALLGATGNDLATVLHRQAVLADALRNPAVVRELYALAVETIERKKKHWFGIFANYPASILHESITMMAMFVEMLRKLRGIAERHGSSFRSPGFSALFATLQDELDEPYLATIEAHLTELSFRKGTLLSARLGNANEGVDHVLRKEHGRGPNWFDRLLGRAPPAYTFHIATRDQAGAQALGELRDRGINEVANAMAQSADHVLSFFQMLRTELAFYVGCLNLHEHLLTRGVPHAAPLPSAAGESDLRFADLHDISLVLTMQGNVIANSVAAEGKRLCVITGANQGGKTSFLRSIGLAQLMMQSGMFVCAASFRGPLCPAICTHYKREEDTQLKSGKFDEELARMSAIVDHLVPDAVVLFNESFAATNQREGSEIARQIATALLESGVRVFFVTHLYPFARGMYDRQRDAGVFLRAERKPDGTRTFKLIEGAPLETSYGADLYKLVFGEDTEQPRADVAPQLLA